VENKKHCGKKPELSEDILKMEEQYLSAMTVVGLVSDV